MEEENKVTGYLTLPKLSHNAFPKESSTLSKQNKSCYGSLVMHTLLASIVAFCVWQNYIVSVVFDIKLDKLHFPAH